MPSIMRTTVRQASWRVTFGIFSLPYNEEYLPTPFSMSYVRHTPAWYAQKHPDDDFAETFAVWLDPESDWRKAYENTGAMASFFTSTEWLQPMGSRRQLSTRADLTCQSKT